MRTISKVANELSNKSFLNLLNLDRDNYSNIDQYADANLINTLVTQFNIFVAGILTPIFNIFTTDVLSDRQTCLHITSLLLEVIS